jgi:hypothetical protein
MNVAFMAFNILRPRGRQRLGLSVGILGNGFALSRATLAAVPYDAHSIVEDLEYHLRLVRAGRRVQFTDKATVCGLMPTSGTGVRTQRTRWEGGRLRMIVQHAPRLAREVVAALALVALHVGAGVIVGGGGMRDLAALAAAPFYILWKLAAAPGILRSARRAAPWIRTSRQ